MKKPQKRRRGSNNNPEGKGGFGDHPEHINKDGRDKKGHTLTDILESYREKKVDVTNVRTGEYAKLERQHKTAQQIWDLAMRGNMAAIHFIWDRIEGKVTEPIEHSGVVRIEFDKTIDDAVRSDPNDTELDDETG